MLTPEPPYPLNGGGAYRIASLVHYFARFAAVDLIHISESGSPALLPPGLIRSQKTIGLPRHGKSAIERYARNARRAIAAVPPLVDRLSGLEEQIAAAIGESRYDIGIVVHSWCAPYVDLMARACDRTLLDLQNVESLLHERCAAVAGGLVAMGHHRFAQASRRLEAELLPRFSLVLATSERDAGIARAIAPRAKLTSYPNGLPQRALPAAREPERPTIVFSGNFAYHPNIDAVAFLCRDIWPALQTARPNLILRLVGRGNEAIRHLLPKNSGIETTGPVADAFAEIAAATLVIAPLRAGSGTRIKILEAWAAGRAIVATPLAAEGLNAQDGENIAIADDAPRFIQATLRLLADPAERARLAASGRAAFERDYTWDAVWRSLDASLQIA